MKKYIYLIVFALVGLVGCDTGTNTPDPQIIHDTVKVDTSKHDTTSNVVAKTCLEYKNGIPVGTYAKRVRTGESVQLDSKGCFSFPARAEVAARSLATGDSVIFYNDSALFSITIPYVSNGDTINVVPTILSMKNCPNTKVDSVFIVVYDRQNILSRRVRMKKANFGDSSEYGRTVWSVEGSTFNVHFEMWDNSSSWPSSVVSSEAGGTVTRDYKQVESQNAVSLETPDTVFFYTDDALICHAKQENRVWKTTCNYTADQLHAHGIGVYRNDSTFKSYMADLPSNYITDTSFNSGYVDSNGDTTYWVYKAGTRINVKSSSIYGIASVKFNGTESQTFTLGTNDVQDSINTLKGHTVTITITDSAGYKKTTKFTAFVAKKLYYMGGDNGGYDGPRLFYYNNLSDFPYGRLPGSEVLNYIHGTN